MPLGFMFIYFSEVSCLKILFVVLNAILIFEFLNKFVIFLTAELCYVKVTYLIVSVVGFLPCGFLSI